MKKHFIRNTVAILLLATAITAVARESAPEALNEKDYQALISSYDKSKDCMFSRTISDWIVLDDQSLILHAPTKNRPYYVKLVRRSLDLKFARQIGILSTFDNRICPYGNNAIFIDGERYRIRAIKKLDKSTAAQLIAFNKTAK